MATVRATAFPLGAAVTIEQLTSEPHPVLASLRAAEPVSWLPALGGWLVTRRDLAEQVLRDPGAFTVDDPRFTTARVVGPSMLSLDGPEHRRHRDPFGRALRRRDVSAGLSAFTAAEADRLVAGLAPAGRAELRRALAGPLAVAVMGQVLGLGDTDPAVLLAWYDAIVAGVSALTAAPADGQVPAASAAAFDELRASLEDAIGRPGASSLLAVAASTSGAERRRDRVERGRDAVRRHRDDRGHDQQRRPAPAERPGQRRQLRPGRPVADRWRHRRVAPAGARSGGRGQVRHRRRRS